MLKLDGNGNKLLSKLFGGSGFEDTKSIVSTSDGYFVAGYTESNDDDINGNKGNRDAWIFKLDVNGNKIWSKVLGGTNAKEATSIVKSNDGNLAVLGTSKSNDVDVSGNHSDQDAFVSKIDNSGNKLSVKVFGGAKWEEAKSILAASNSGFILCGSTNSNDGYVIRNHGGYDGYIMKVTIPSFLPA